MRVDVDAVKGRTSTEGVRVLADRLRPEHGVVVFPLGTNDSPADPARLAADLAAAKQIAGDRCIVVATIARPRVGGVPPAGLNSVVERFASASGAAVADWHSVVRSIPSLLGADGVHATGEGYGVRATLIAEAVQSCLAGGAGSGIPAPRDPDAAPPPRRVEAQGPPLLLPSAELVSAFAAALARALTPLGGALHAAANAATGSRPGARAGRRALELDLGVVGGEVAGQRLAHRGALARAREAVAAEQLLLALEREARDLPAHREPLEQELDAPLPAVLSRGGRRARRARRAGAASRRSARRAA